MSESQKMTAALQKHVIANLVKNGFTGKYPHFRKAYPDRIELLAFQTNKWGNSFTVEVSTVFAPYDGTECNLGSSKVIPFEEINVWHTNQRYRLQGMFDGWFYYCNVYYYKPIFQKPQFTAVSREKSLEYKPRRGEKLVQQADADVYERVCAEVNKQMITAYQWWEQFNSHRR